MIPINSSVMLSSNKKDVVSAVARARRADHTPLIGGDTSNILDRARKNTSLSLRKLNRSPVHSNQELYSIRKEQERVKKIIDKSIT